MKKAIIGVVLALVLVLAIPMAALAGTTESDTSPVSGTSEVKGNVPTWYSITVPDEIDLETLSTGSAISKDATISATTNDGTKSTVTLSAVGTDYTPDGGTAPNKPGQLRKWTGTTLDAVLSPALTIKSVAGQWTISEGWLYQPCTGTAQSLVDGQHSGTVTITQGAITSPTGTALEAGDYTETVEFTATFA